MYLPSIPLYVSPFCHPDISTALIIVMMTRESVHGEWRKVAHSSRIVDTMRFSRSPLFFHLSPTIHNNIRTVFSRQFNLKRHSAFPTMSALWLHDFLRDTKWRGAPRETRTTNSALTTYAICRHAERAATHSTLQQLCKKAAARSFSPSLLLSATLASLISAQWDQSRCMQSGLLQRVTRK